MKRDIVFYTISIINGALYYFNGKEGEANLGLLVNNAYPDILAPIGTIASVDGSIVYAFFMYQTILIASNGLVKPDTTLKKCLTVIAPLPALAFLTAGTGGALRSNLSNEIALTIGMLLFALRTFNYVIAMWVFPARLQEIKNDYLIALQKRDSLDLIRIFNVVLFSIIFAVCNTDTIYSAVSIICSWFSLSQTTIANLSYYLSIIGAAGVLPLITYWNHRGFRQLTLGGKVDADGNTPDPTDWHTFAALLLVLPTAWGVVGSASVARGQMLTKAIDNITISQTLRVASSLFYTACAATVGVAAFLRKLSKDCFSQKAEVEIIELPYLKPLPIPDCERISFASSSSYFKKNLNSSTYLTPPTADEDSDVSLVVLSVSRV